MLLSCGFIAWKWWEQRSSATGYALIMPLLWSIFALVLLAKMGLNTRIWHYGFYLAMPAAVFVVFTLLWIIPQELQKSGANPFVFRLLITIFLGIGGIELLMYSDRYYQAKDLSVGEAGDRIVSFSRRLTPESEGIRQTVRWLRKNTAPTSTVATMPGGMLVNYLARRPNPTRYPALSPVEFIAHSEARILADYVHNSPDYVVLIHCDSREFGVRYFGQDPAYGRDIMRWVRSNYSPVWQYGEEPLQTERFGIRILIRSGRTVAQP